jgi:hypothetical protein
VDDNIQGIKEVKGERVKVKGSRCKILRLWWKNSKFKKKV